ncbi:MAG TPA: serine hydrolase [Candidatus Obscuribacterales bacterium]
MVDKNSRSHNDPSPFRRYVPPSPPSNGNGNGRLTPLSGPPRSPEPGAIRGTPRRQRPARNRWRQWVQNTVTPTPTSRPAPAAAPEPRSGLGMPPVPPVAAPRRQPPLPREGERSPQPTARRHEPSAFVQPPAAPAPAPAPGRSAPRRRPSNKVTPLRRPPVWSTPAAATAAPAPRRDRPVRRPTRKTPQPILYGIRLLILGTGIAAIAGTVLSSLNPNRAPSAAGGDPGAAPVTALGTDSPLGRSTVTQPLPLATELAAVETDLVGLESMTPGLTQSLFFYDLETGNYIDLNGSTAVAAASTIKVPILVAFLQAVDAGTLTLNQAVTLREDLLASGSGDLQTQAIGTQYTAWEVATEMIVNSDNTATNLMIMLLGGVDGLNQQFQDWGLESTVLRNLLPDLDGTNLTSAADLVRVMALVDQGELLTPRSRDRLFSIMQRTYNRTLIPGGLSDETAIAYNKTGDIGTALGDVALVDVANGKRYLLIVLVTRPFNDGRASELIRRVSGRVYEEMSQPISPVGSGDLPAAPPPLPPSGTDPTVNPAAPQSEAYPEPSVPAMEPEAEAEPYYAPEGDAFSNPAVPPG